MQAQSHDSTLSVRVDVRLCGGIPRKDMKDQLPSAENAGARCPLTSPSVSKPAIRSLAVANGPTSTLRTIACDERSGLGLHNSNMMQFANEEQRLYSNNAPLAQLMEPPSWAVPARGESRLEPTSDSVGRQSAVDLTRQSSFSVGRSPHCAVQLHHATSSRRHAMLFHHANGSCYAVDCGSAHGTFVNGKRISGPAAGGVVVPHKVRRGAMIRFGGPGAPTFIMKSFAFRLQDIDMSETQEAGDLIRRNTRINALGKTACAVVSETIYQALAVCRKRSFDSLDSHVTLELEEPSAKRVRCSSPPLSPEEPLRLVSPDLLAMTGSKPRRVTFSKDPPQAFYPAMVTPEVLSGAEDS